MTIASPLQLVQESKICDLLPEVEADERWEASGVLARDGSYYIVFDDRTAVARIGDDLRVQASNGLLGTAPSAQGFEGIAYNPHKQRFYLLVESRKLKKGKHQAEVFEYSQSLECIKHRRVDFTFKSNNKGFEAVSHVQRDDQDYVLALCEGNKCRGGRQGRQPGGGRIQLFEKKQKCWSHLRTIKLPKSVLFSDYSAMAIDRDRVAVVSQENSALWIGMFDTAKWEWRDEGRIYEFPRTAGGEILYGNVEGVDWLTPYRIVTVSDRRKQDQPTRFAEKDESIHVFEIPR